MPTVFSAAALNCQELLTDCKEGHRIGLLQLPVYVCSAKIKGYLQSCLKK